MCIIFNTSVPYKFRKINTKIYNKKPPLTPTRPPLAPPKEGNKNTPPSEGNKETPTSEGNKETPPSEGNKETPPSEANKKMPPSEAYIPLLWRGQGWFPTG
jgi:hypothetical protein